MPYDKGKYRLVQLGGKSELDTTMRLDVTALDDPQSAYTDIPVAVVVITNGYYNGSNGEQSLDPATGVATYSEFTDDVSASSFLVTGDYVESYYDQVLGFAGFVTQIAVTIAPNPGATKHGYRYVKRITYTLSSMEAQLLAAVASWDTLPQESALTRLGRWFIVDTAEVAPSHRYRLDFLVDAEEIPGSATLLDLARAFTAATRIPLRLALLRDPNYIEAFDSSLNWSDQPLVPVGGFEDAAPWTNEVTFIDTVPDSISVLADDLRLMSGVSTVTVDQKNIDDDFYLDAARLDVATEQSVGFRAPQPIDVFGFVMPGLRVTQTFADDYQAQIELDRVGGTTTLGAA